MGTRRLTTHRCRTDTGGQLVYGGIGFLEATESKDNQFTVSSSHIFTFLGAHTLMYGYQFEDDVYNDLIRYTGPDFTLPNDPALKAAAGQIVVRRDHDPHPPEQRSHSADRAEDDRGNVYSSPVVATDTRYHAGFIEDSWTFGRITFKPGIRFEQQALLGNTQSYSFAHNWAPRLGIIIDPMNDRKTKIFASAGRFFEKIPLDIAVRELSVETQLTGASTKIPDRAPNPTWIPATTSPAARSPSRARPG